MIGLEYLSKINNIEFQTVANELGISKQAVNQWIKGKTRISKKHYEKLKEIFKVPEEYFQKELTELDKLKLQQLKLENDTFEYTYTDVIWDNETQQEIEVEQVGTNIPYEQMEMLNLDIKEKELFKKIKDLISDRIGEPENEWDYIGRKTDILEIFETLVKTMEERYISDRRVKNVLESIEIAKGKRLANSLFVKKLSMAIKEQMMRDKKTEEENTKEAKELIKLGIYKNDEIEDLL